MPLLRFEALFKNKEIHQEFHKFLTEDKSEESWDFLKTSMKYTKKNTKVTQLQLNKLSDKYLKEEAPKCLNLSSEARKKVISELEKGNVDSLKSIQTTILSETKYDSFKRFCRTKQCQKFVKKYEKDNNIVLPE